MIIIYIYIYIYIYNIYIYIYIHLPSAFPPPCPSQNCTAISWYTSWEMISPASKNVQKILPKSSQHTSKITPKSLQNPPPGGLWGVLGGSGGPLGPHLAPGRPSLPGSYWILSVSGLRWAPQMGTKTPQSRYSSKLGAQSKGFWGGPGPPKACLFGHMQKSLFDQHYHTKPLF